MSEFIRISVYREPLGLSCHIEHMVGAMPRPRVVRRKELTWEAREGTPTWAAAVEWAGKQLLAESRRLRVSPPARPAPPTGGHGGLPSNPQPLLEGLD